MERCAISFFFLLPILLSQCFVITYLLHKQTLQNEEIANLQRHMAVSSPLETSDRDLVALPLSEPLHSTATSPSEPSLKFEGVAATLMLNSPKWFQRRYTFMIQNILLNTPPTWAIQIFHSTSSKSNSQFGIDINPGMTRLAKLYPQRIIFTEVPEKLIEEKGLKWKKLYWTDKWIWEQMVAERVLVFSGNGAFCSNSRTLSIADGTAVDQLLNHVDYVGPPWFNLHGIGGDGAISYRNRTAMLDVINYRPYDGDREEAYFIKTMLDMNKELGNERYRVATKQQTYAFGLNLNSFVDNEDEDLEDIGPPMMVAGTIPQLDHDKRELLLFLCPELKVIFPSLHHPSCFGGQPNGTECGSHICALQGPGSC